MKREVECKTGNVNRGQIIKEQQFTKSMNFMGFGVTEESTSKVTSFSKSFILLLISKQAEFSLLWKSS